MERDDVGFNLKIDRLRHGIRQIELARHIGMTTTRLSLIENAWRRPTADQAESIRAGIDRLAQAKGVSNGVAA